MTRRWLRSCSQPRIFFRLSHFLRFFCSMLMLSDKLRNEEDAALKFCTSRKLEFKKSNHEKLLKLIKELAEDNDSYKEFFDQFNTNLMLGIHEHIHKPKCQCPYPTLLHVSLRNESHSLANYVDRKKENQKPKSSYLVKVSNK